MRTWETRTTVPGSPSAVLELLTEPDAIARWSPVPFEIVSLGDRRLRTGSRAQVAGGSDIRASICVEGRGLFGRVLAKCPTWIERSCHGATGGEAGVGGQAPWRVGAVRAIRVAVR
jgi:hypothetical protein